MLRWRNSSIRANKYFISAQRQV